MHSLESYLIPVIFAFWATVFFVPIVKLIALRYNFVDRPEARKMHKEPIPLMGGLGIFVPFIVSLLLFYRGISNLNLRGVVICGVLVLLLGFWDDKVGGIKWNTKLLGQVIISVLVVMFFGIKVTIFHQDYLNIAVSVFWLTFITNSLNLLDNMDGLSAGVASIAAFFYFILAYRAGQYDLALFSIVLSACALGFLKYNFSPASIFMGDMGSMFLGFTLGCIAIRLQVTQLSSWYIVAQYANNFNFAEYQFLTAFATSIIPLLVLGLPVFDTALVSVLRVLNGLKISTPGKDHSSHRLTHLKGKIQRVIDRFIVTFIRATGRNKKSQHHILKSMAQTRTVLILYASAGFLGLSSLLVSQLGLDGLIVMLFVVVFIALFSAKKLSEVLVYKK